MESVLVRVGVAAVVAVAGLVGRAHRFIPDEQVVAAGVPRGPGAELDLERDPAIRIAGRRGIVQEPVDQAPAEVSINVRGLKLRPPLVPPCHDTALADEASELHLEQVREVRAQGDLEVEADGHEPVVHDIQVLVDAITDGTADDERQRARGDVAVLSRDNSVGEVDARCEARRGGRVQALPRPTGPIVMVGTKCPSAAP